MMAVYICTGKLGAGKTLCAVGKMRDAILENRKIATNIDLWLENLINVDSKRCEVYRLPDKISREAIDSVGMGSDKFGEENNGIMVLDEGGLLFNSRDYRQQHIKDFISWMVHARKKRWDIILIIQHFEALDKQIRDMFGEHLITCLRTDRIKIPLFGFLLNVLTLGNFSTPRLHTAITRYGTTAKDPVVDKDYYRGTDLYDGFDTEQKYDFNDDSGTFLYLPPFYTVGRYVSTRSSQLEKWKARFADFSKAPPRKRKFFLTAVLTGLLLGRYWLPSVPELEEPKQLVENEEQKTPKSGFSLSAGMDAMNGSPDSEQVNYHPLHGLSLTGAYVSDGQYYYFWQRYGESAKPPQGYKLTPVSEFKAILKKDDELHEITGQPYNPN